MAINLTKYKDSLLAAWKDVVDDKSLTDWALFGYEGQSNDLKVVSKGAGGIEEMTEDLNSGKIMYAFCKVLDPKTSLPKCVLINWQGEGSPIVRKGTCAKHVRDVGNFFKGAHVTFNARNEEEVDTHIIIDKVAKSTGSAYSFKERGDHSNESGPIGTTYKRVIPRQEINSKERDKFWEKEEQEEKQRQAEERSRKDEERAKLENERKQRELTEAVQREERIKERTKSISQLREAERSTEEHSRVKDKGGEELAEREREDQERKGRSDILRRQRSQEAQSVISKRTFNARAIFEQNTSAGQMHSLRRASLTQQQIVNATPVANSNHEVIPPLGRKASLPTWPPAESELAQVPVVQLPILHNNINNVEQRREPSPVASPEPIISPVEHFRTELSPVEHFRTELSPVEHFRTELSPTQLHQVEVDTLIPKQEPTEVPTQRLASPLQQNWEVGLQETLGLGDNSPLEQDEDGLVYDQVDLGTDDIGLQARALYDYQAADPTEITFDPGDIITHIDQIDEGWWQGLGPDGTFGLFPANYVELIN